jgi:hypothetical protein
VDCGGATCPPCGNGEGCAVDRDCRSNACEDDVCVGQACEPGTGNCDAQLGCETALDTLTDCGACDRVCPTPAVGEATCVEGVCGATECAVDGFDGVGLAPHWTLAAGAAPTLAIDGSRLVIDDAPHATTPSSPTQSWIFEPDVDLGNQLAWAQPFGSDDFTLEVQLGWTSTAAELTIAGIGLSNADDQLELQLGVIDGFVDTVGRPYVSVRRPGADLVLEQASFAEIANLVIFAVGYTDAGGPRPFGRLVVDQPSLCR